jgi:CBS domain-containing protein
MTSHLSVFCPRRDTSLAVRECLACPRCEGLIIRSAEHESELTCRYDDGHATAPIGKRLLSSAPPHSAAAHARVADVMTRTVICVTPDVTLETAISLLVHHEISALPVTDADGRVLGILSKTDVIRDRYERGRSPDEETMPLAARAPLEAGFHEEVAPSESVDDAMTKIAFTLHENASLSQAAALMVYEGIHRIPVTDQDGRVVGVLSSLDVLEWLAHQDGYVLPPRERPASDGA